MLQKLFPKFAFHSKLKNKTQNKKKWLLNFINPPLDYAPMQN